jgi:hypothetical protein
MGVEAEAVNVSDLRISRPDRSGPGGDEVGSGTEIGAALDACYSEQNRTIRDADGREVIVSGEFFINPITDGRGAVVPVLVGDLAEWTDHQGVAVDAQEIVAVRGLTDCTSRLDIVQFQVGRTASAGA